MAAGFYILSLIYFKRMCKTAVSITCCQDCRQGVDLMMQRGNSKGLCCTCHLLALSLWCLSFSWCSIQPISYDSSSEGKSPEGVFTW